jgi:hypothetical protein
MEGMGMGMGMGHIMVKNDRLEIRMLHVTSGGRHEYH